MKILQICGSYSWGGLEMQTLIISETLAKYNNEVILICPKNSQFEKEKIKYGTQLYTINYKKNFIYTLHSFINAFNSLKPDIIHCQLSKDLRYIIPALSLLRLKTPLIFTKRMRSKINKKDIFHNYLFKRIDKIFAISEYVKVNLLETTSLKHEQIEVLYNGIDLDKFNPLLYNKNIERDKLSININTKVIGIIGRITPLKGHYEFINAASILKRIIRDNVKFIIVGGASIGENEYFNQLKIYAISRLGANFITFIDFTNEIPRFLSIMDFVIIPSYEESFGNVALEAMAMGVPVIASASGGLSEIIKHNDTGILAKPQNMNSIAECIYNNLYEEVKINDICANARDFVLKNHDINLYIEKLQKNYNSLINKSPNLI